MRILVAALGCTLGALFTLSAQTPPAVPAQYQDVYDTVSTDINNFQELVSGSWDGSTYPVAYSTQLQSADSDLTYNLLVPEYYQYTVLSELNDLQAMGVEAVTFHLNFPALYQPYYSNPAEYQNYLNFYTQLVNEIHGRGLKVIIENTNAVAYPGNNGASFGPYYQSLDWPTYQSQRAQLAASIAQLLQPDYLVVVTEPDTEATATGQVNAGTVSGSTQMVQGIVAAVQNAGAPNVQVGAGCGTWNPSFLQFEQSFAGLPLQFIDMHIYPVNGNFLPNALTAVSQIAAAGKQITISEMWSNKEEDSEVGVLSYTDVFARNAFSFWYPLDISFLQTMSNFANAGQFTFVSPFWSQNFAAYLDFNTYGALPDATVISDEGAAANLAHGGGVYSSTGLAYETLVINFQDTTPPQVPAPPALLGASQTAVYLQWTATTDNVGVAAYNVYRNGVLVGTANSPKVYPDLGLTAATAYTYTIAAFDASGNLSPQSAPISVTTLPNPDYTPPSIPTGVAGTPVSDSQISLTWTPSVDNVGVLGYEIFRGTSPDALIAWATTPTNSYADTLCAPNTVYYYAVNAYDAFYNFSANSVTISAATLPDTTPPTMPGNLTVTATATSATLTWTASMDDVFVAYYTIYRGDSASDLMLMAGEPAPGTAFTDTRVDPGKTYYYSVAAVDEAKNVSVLATPVAVMTPSQ